MFRLIKPTHTVPYLNATSHHHPQYRNGLIKTLFSLAGMISDSIYFKKKHAKLYQALKMKGYSKIAINHAKRTRRPKDNHAPKSTNAALDFRHLTNVLLWNML